MKKLVCLILVIATVFAMTMPVAATDDEFFSARVINQNNIDDLFIINQIVDNRELQSATYANPNCDHRVRDFVANSQTVQGPNEAACQTVTQKGDLFCVAWDCKIYIGPGTMTMQDDHVWQYLNEYTKKCTKYNYYSYATRR